MTQPGARRPLSLGTLRALIGAQIALFFGIFLWSSPPSDAGGGHIGEAFWVVAVMAYPLLGIVLHALLRAGRRGPVVGVGWVMSYQARTLLASGLMTGTGFATWAYWYTSGVSVPMWAVLSAVLLQYCWPSRKDFESANGSADRTASTATQNVSS